MTFATNKITSTKVLGRHGEGYYIQLNCRLRDWMATQYIPLTAVLWVSDADTRKFDSNMRKNLSSRASALARKRLTEDSYYWNFDKPEAAIQYCNDSVNRYKEGKH